MEKNNWFGWVIGILIVVGLGYLLFAKGTPTTPQPSTGEAKEYKIGVITPLTGDVAVIGIPLQKTVKLAVDEINAKGGVGGKKLVAVYEDGKCDGKEAATAAQRLINVEKVELILGTVCSGETLGVAPLANESKTVVISPSATSPDITTKGGDYTFRFAPSDALAGKVAAQYAAKDLSAKKVAIISENTEYAQGLHRVFAESSKQAGGDVAVDEVYNTGTTDFRTQATKVKNADVDVVYLIP